MLHFKGQVDNWYMQLHIPMLKIILKITASIAVLLP